MGRTYAQRPPRLQPAVDTGPARIEWGDTLNSPALVEADRLMRFNVVVANPPFSLDKWGAAEAQADRYNRFWCGVPPKSKGDYAFVTHMIETALPQEGRVAVVVPHSVLFRGGAEGCIRRTLIEENLLDAVIGLPGNLFPTTSIPAAILVFDRARATGGVREACQDVLFIDASQTPHTGPTVPHWRIAALPRPAIPAQAVAG